MGNDQQISAHLAKTIRNNPNITTNYILGGSKTYKITVKNDIISMIDCVMNISTHDFYIGRTDNCAKRYDTHMSDPARRHMKYMAVLWQTTKTHIANVEKRIICRFFGKPHCTNDTKQYAGGISDNSQQYLYIITSHDIL